MDGDGAPGRSASADELVASLRRYEHLLRETFSAGGQVQTAVARAQADANLSIVAGHQIYGSISNANQGVSGAISHTAEMHRLLEALGRRLGYDVTSFGVEQAKPTSGWADGEQPRMRSVA